MSPVLRRARTRLTALLVLATFDAGLAPGALANDDGRRVRLDELERQQAQTEELKALARSKRHESIERLKGLLAQAPEGDRKAEMMLRLASLYFEEGRSLYLDCMEATQQAVDACYDKTDDLDKCRFECDTREAFDWYTKTAKLYQAIIKGYPQYARSDEATFYLGMTQNEMKQVEDAQESFKRLVKLYPASNYVPDAYILIGDYYFDKNEAFPALRAYLKAASYNDHARYPYAMYKLAWCYYNVEEYGKSIDTMKAVVTYSMQRNQGQQKSGLRLEDEALRDLVRFFADAGDMDEALRYFTGLGRPDLYRSALKRLASLYFEQGKFVQSVESYRRLIMETPSHVENPGYQEEIIAAYRKIGDKDRVLDEIRRLRTDYGKTSAWWRANAGSPDAQKSADETIEKALRRTATDFNKEARDLRTARHPRAEDAFRVAVDAYYVYLEDYGKAPSSYNVHYDFGELLYLLKRYEEAYREYMTVVDMDPNGQHSRFCAESAIFAAEEMVKKEGGGAIQPKKKVFDKDVQPEALSDWENKLVDACARYAKLYPKDPKVETAIYKGAFLLYSRFHFTRAAELFRDVIAMNPRSQNAEFSANLILDALKIKEEWVALRDTAKAFYEQESLGSKAFKKDMYGIYSAASFTVIEKDFEKNQDFGKTADALVAFSDTFPDFEKVDIALNNAAAYYFKADRVADSMKVRHVLVEDPKFAGKTKFYYAQVANLGFDYERLADFASAAKYYDKLLELYGDERKKVAKEAESKLGDLDGQAADALYSAALFRNALGDWQGSVDRYRRFLTLFPADDRGAEIRLVVARIFEDRKDATNAALAFNAFYTKDVKDPAPEMGFFARLHEGRALLSQGRTTDAHKVYRASIDLYEKARQKGLEPGAHTEFVAEMMYELTKADAAAYMAIQIKGAGTRNRKQEDDAYKRTLKEKTAGLVGLEKSYKAILETGAGEWGLSAIVALGKAYENMGETLKTSPCPFYLTDDQCDIYKMTLEDKAYVQTEKAVEAYKLALEKSYELNVYNDNAAFATRRLGVLRPDDYPGLFEQLPAPGLTAEKARTFDVEKSLD